MYHAKMLVVNAMKRLGVTFMCPFFFFSCIEVVAIHNTVHMQNI